MNLPISLNKYIYANGNPIIYTDPSGKIVSIADVLSGINIQSTNRTQSINHNIQTGINMLRRACEATENIISLLHRHHVVPKFIGGKKTWDDDLIMGVEQIVHNRFHTLLDLMLKMNGMAGRGDKKFGMSATEYYEKLYRRLPSAKPAVLEILIDVSDVFDQLCDGVGSMPF